MSETLQRQGGRRVRSQEIPQDMPILLGAMATGLVAGNGLPNETFSSHGTEAEVVPSHLLTELTLAVQAGDLPAHHASAKRAA